MFLPVLFLRGSYFEVYFVLLFMVSLFMCLVPVLLVPRYVYLEYSVCSTLYFDVPL